MSAALPLTDSIGVMQEPCAGSVALVCMPWGSVLRPSLAMGILKGCVQNAGLNPELHFLNIHFAQYIGIEAYEKIVEAGVFQTEWFFAQALFGPSGSAEMQNSWADLRMTAPGMNLAGFLQSIAGNSEDGCRKIVEAIPSFIEHCMKIDWSKYLAIGFTTTFAQSLASLLLAKHIKEAHPQVKIIIGGANVDAEMGVEFVRAFSWVDYAVHGEAENNFPMLIRNIAENRSEVQVPGVTMRINGQMVRGDMNVGHVVDLNQSPFPDYSDYVHELERAGFRRKTPLLLYFESSRGCWWGAKHHCTFCGLNGSNMAFRRKDPQRVFNEVVELSTKYRCLSLFAADNILANEYFTQLLPRLSSLDSDINLFFEVKANLRREQVKALRAAGIKNIQPGIESFNTRILRLMRKGVTAIQNIQLLKWCDEFGVDPFYNILFGFPGEVPEDYQDLPRTIRLLMHLRPPGGLNKVVFERFSPYFFDRDSFGLNLRANSAYFYIFPESRVEMDKIAYFFEGEWQNQVAQPTEYIQPTREAVSHWVDAWKAGTAFCCYEKGLNHILIHDSRPRSFGSKVEERRVYLNEQMSAMYLFCDENRSAAAVYQMMMEKFGSGITEKTVRSWLDNLVVQELMYKDGDRYLSLAVRRKRPSRPTLPNAA